MEFSYGRTDINQSHQGLMVTFQLRDLNYVVKRKDVTPHGASTLHHEKKIGMFWKEKPESI